jgi:hypothetical protein
VGVGAGGRHCRDRAENEGQCGLSTEKRRRQVYHFGSDNLFQ